MIAIRWAVLAVAVVVMLAAFGATETDLQPSALRVAVTAIVGLLAPLFWPGSATTAARTALRIGGWLLAAVSVAAIALRFTGDHGQPFARILPACAMLTLILLVTHTLAVGLEGHWRGESADAEMAREMAGRAAATVLAFLGSAPLWLGPAAELLARRHAWIIDAVIGISPLTHLALASGNDLLRNPWFYQHSNLAALQFSYPGLSDIILLYSMVALVLAVIPLASRRLRRPIENDQPILPTMEQSK
jgi:hypothetical protein